MTDLPAGPHDVVVTVRYFAGARAAAGLEQERVTLPLGSTVADALRRASTRGPALARVIAASSVLVGGVHRRFADATLIDGATLDVLPPFAGG